MTTNLEKFKQDIERLGKTGETMLRDLLRQAEGESTKKGIPDPGSIFWDNYQKWYSEAYEVIRQILPSRLMEFEKLYKGDEKRKSLNQLTYAIQDWFLGISYGGEEEATWVFMRFQTQLEILNSAHARFESSLFDIRQILQADLFDSELEAARELLKSGFLRPAGAVAGVVLEKHLAQVCQNHKVTMKRKDPNISNFNDALKGAGVIEVPGWRFIQRLGDLRNLCDHNKEREPKKEEVMELIDGVAKIMKTLF